MRKSAELRGTSVTRPQALVSQVFDGIFQRGAELRNTIYTPNRVKGKYMYRKTAAELPQIAERGAQEIEKKAMAYLEGKG